MNPRRWLSPVLLFGALLPLAAAPENSAGGCPAGSCAAGAPAAPGTPLVLGEETRQALIFQAEEERMARELYAAFGARWELRPFLNIQRSEARHEAALAALAARASLTLPAANAGVFTVTEVQHRYDAILARGQASAEAALRAGALVEETDIADLRAMAATTTDPEVKATLAALERASENHLRAFVRNLRARGIGYEPTVLSAADFGAIVAADSRGGGHGRGPGSGRGAGRGREG